MSRRKAFDTDFSSSSRPVRSNLTMPSQSSSKRSPSFSAIDTPASGSSGPSKITPSSSASSATSNAPQMDPATELEADDSGQCFICAEPITFWSAGVCQHRTCHLCAVRLRTFYKMRDCTFCKTPLPSLLFCRSPTIPFPPDHHVTPSPPEVIAAAHAAAEKLPKGERWDRGLTLPGTLDLSKYPHTDEKLGVVFEDEDMMEATLLLLRFNCPYPDCPHMAGSWEALERHTLSTHGLVLCSLCRRQLNRFAHEQVLYPPHLLALHDPSRLARGQRPPRPRGDKEIEVVRGWEPPHPVCEFCHEALFDPDELFQHMRKKHEECFVCKNLGERDVYFQNYPKLEVHFNQDHFPCTQPICQEKKFVIFGSEMDLKAHMVAEHGEHMSARDRAQARQIPVNFTSYETRPPQPREARGNSGRGFTLQQTAASSNAGPSRREAPPHQQQIAQPPLMVPEQAAQHRRQVQADRQDEGRRRKVFATNLTDGDRDKIDVPRPYDHGHELSGSGFATPREEVDDGTSARHAALLSRMALLTYDSPIKLSSFRSAVRQFRNNESGAQDMIDTIYNVLDQDADATSGVAREIAGLFDGEGESDKRSAVLEALNAFRVALRDQFPALNHPSGLGGEWAGITSGKILNAKRATHTGRGGSSRVVWDRVEAAAASQPVNRPVRATAGLNGKIVPGSSGGPSSTSAFPSLGMSTTGQSRTPAAHSTPWSSGGAGSSSKSPPALTGPIIRSVNFPTAATKSGKTKPPSQSAFPSLPPSTKSGAAERQALFAKPGAREESIRRITGQTPAPPPALNGWGSVRDGVESMAIQDSSPIIEDGEDERANGGGGKKKGKGKQLLFSVSARPS